MAGERMRYSDEDLDLETNLLKDTVEREEHAPQNIAIIGQHGCGKSSFINTAMAVLRSDGEYHERALVGNFDLEGQHVTRRLTRYTKEKYLESSIAVTYNYPSLLDMTGFQNSNDEKAKEVLKAIFQGRFKEGAKLNFETGNQQYVPEKFQQLFSEDEANMKVDKIIFVASAKSKEFPTELIKAVISQASGEERDIPVFGVLTHADEVEENDEEFGEFEKRFKRSLGLSHLRYLLCTNYCDDVPRENKRDPDIEVPVMRFLRQVIDPAREVYQERVWETAERLKNTKLKTLVLYILQIFLILIYLWFLMLPPYGIQSSCDSYKYTESNGCRLSSIDSLCKLSSEGKIMTRPPILVLFIIFAFIRFCTRPILEMFLRNHPEYNLFFNQSIYKIYKNYLESNRQ